MRCWLVALLTGAACAGQPDTDTLKERPAGAAPVLVREAFAMRLPDSTAINGAAFYHGRDGAHWVIATTTRDALVVFDAVTGAVVRTIGSSGTGMGELRGPDGIAVLGDSIALVVERDNGRVQGFHLPDFTSIGTFGERLFEHVTAITAYLAGNAYAVYVTDNRASGFGRVVQFRLTVGNGELIAIHWRTFGDTTGNGAMHSSDAIAVDAEYNRLLITDHESGQSSIRVYDVDGRFSGQIIGGRAGNVEGVGLYGCGNKRGYWVAKGDSGHVAQLLDRASLARVGEFALTTGQIVRIMAASPRSYEKFSAGALIAMHQDGDLRAISWREIASALQLETDCAAR